MLAKLSIGEFIQYTSRFMKEGSFILTRYGKPIYEMNIKSLSGGDLAKRRIAKTELAKNPLYSEGQELCKHSGCQREGTYHRGYCMEHWREA